MSRTSFWRLETHIASQLSTLDEINHCHNLTVTWCLRQDSEVPYVTWCLRQDLEVPYVTWCLSRRRVSEVPYGTWCLRQVSGVPYHDLVSEASFRGTLPWPGVWGMFQRYLTMTWRRRQVSEVHSSEPASEGHSLVRCTSSQRLSSTALWSGPVSSLSRVELKTPIILLILPSIIYVGWAVPEQESFFSNSNTGRVVAVREAWFAPSVQLFIHKLWT